MKNVKVNNSDSDVTLTKNGFVNLTFNSKVDSNQLPLTMYAIDWGDGESTTVTGVEMRDRPNADVPHSLYHLYSYWDLKAKRSSDQNDPATPENENTIYCGSAGDRSVKNYNGTEINVFTAPLTPPNNNYCVIKPKVQIKDNWGWYNNGTAINTTGDWDSFGEDTVDTTDGWVLVKEK